MSRQKQRKLIRSLLRAEHGISQSELDRWCAHHGVNGMDEAGLKELYRELRDSDPLYFDRRGNLDLDFD
jgi:hypothetical protein